jgi:hypothetical protein
MRDKKKKGRDTPDICENILSAFGVYAGATDMHVNPDEEKKIFLSA